jgi:hypothetical protein
MVVAGAYALELLTGSVGFAGAGVPPEGVLARGAQDETSIANTPINLSLSNHTIISTSPFLPAGGGRDA